MKKISIFLCSFLFCLSSYFPLYAAEPVAAETASYNGSPYYIMVNRQQNVVTIYTLDENEQYTVPYKAMVCSTAKEGRQTPLGTFSLTGSNQRWCLMVDGTYGQYSSQFYGNYLFHSICYTRPQNDCMITEEYNLLGEKASLGCVRLQTADAKWIYENCPAGTRVTVYESEETGPFEKPQKAVPFISENMANGWDPTDPAEGNPWNCVKIEEILPSQNQLVLKAGQAEMLQWSVLPTEADAKRVAWMSENPEVATVDAEGRVIGMGAGQTFLEASAGEVAVRLPVTVEGELLPFADVVPGEWYYENIRFAVENGIMSGIEPFSFEPDGTITRAMLAQMLYQFAAAEEREYETFEWEDVPVEEWYYPAVCWAYGHGILLNRGGGFAPGEAVSRQELAAALYRYETVYLRHEAKNSASLGWYVDTADVDAECTEAMCWAVGNRYLSGVTEFTLCPKNLLTRAQCAAVFQRYLESMGYVQPEEAEEAILQTEETELPAEEEGAEIEQIE